MNRREAIRRVTMLLGGAVAVGSLGAFTETFIPLPSGGSEFNLSNQEDLIAEISDTIIPDTKGVPGAKAAGLGPFIVMMMQDCYTENVQRHFAEGLKKVEEVCNKQFNKSFAALTLDEREEIFKVFKNEAEAQKKAGIDPSHFFQIMIELTFLGYYTSEIGATKALRYVHIPGKYEACIPLQPGQKAWAT